MLTWHPSHEAPPAPVDADTAIEDATSWWQGWSQQSTYRGEWADPVERSLITLKALTYAPTGGIVAAPTTSLPEHLGSSRNWDYRFVWLPGYEDSAPVRIGNGIWEMRGPKRAFTHSRVMAWVALDRAVKSVEASGLDGPATAGAACVPRSTARSSTRASTRSATPSPSTTARRRSMPALLLIPQVGFLPADDPRVHGTVEAVQRELGLGDGLLFRYVTDDSPDGLPPGEGAFLLCSYWLVDALTMIGRCEEARRIFDHLLTLRNDVGLLAEEYEPSAGRLLGNFPQAFSHLGLVASAYTLGTGRSPADERAND